MRMIAELVQAIDVHYQTVSIQRLSNAVCRIANKIDEQPEAIEDED